MGSKPINISASRGAAILGMSKWNTPVNVWLQIMESRKPGFCDDKGYELPVIEENAAMRWGTAFEDAVIEIAEENAGDEIIAREELHVASRLKIPGTEHFNFLTCHIDGKYRMNEELHEGKTTSAFYYNDNFGEPGTDRVPPEYQIQCQHQMICTGAEKVILSVLVFPRRVEEWEEMGYIPVEIEKGTWRIGRENKVSVFNPSEWAFTLYDMGYFYQYEIKANNDLHKKMVERYLEWWNTHVINETEPDPQTYDDIKMLYTAPKMTIIASEEVEYMLAEYKQINEEIGTTGPLSKRKEQIKIDALAWARSASNGVLDDESMEKLIIRNESGKKLGSYGRNKNGILIFR